MSSIFDHPRYFKYNLVKNLNYYPLYRKHYKKINNTSLIIIWKNPKTKETRYLLQKRSKKMKRGRNKLAIGGGMLEKSDKTLQAGAIREVLEESQIQFKSKHNLSKTTIKELEPYLFPLHTDSSNFTFYLIIRSTNEPKVKGPVMNGKIKPFLNSSREIDLEDDYWNDRKLYGKVKNGHAFLNKKEILRHFKYDLKLWKYTKKSLTALFQIFE